MKCPRKDCAGKLEVYCSPLAKGRTKVRYRKCRTCKRTTKTVETYVASGS